MYCNYYGFSERPFEPTPDPSLLYLGKLHREVHAALLYGIVERRGFIVVVGEVGTGKTSLLRSVMNRLDPNVKVATITNTNVTFDQLLQMVIEDLGIAAAGQEQGKAAAIERLNQLAIGQFRHGGNVVIMVDEAQNLDRRCMENLRLLSNLETSKTKLIQIILCGQPELDDKLRQPDLRQLAQRINLRRCLVPFDQTETMAYIQHRLKAVQYSGSALFTRSAQGLIWGYSGGIPRKINTVCDNALLTGYAMKRPQIDEYVLHEVIKDLTHSPFRQKDDAASGAATHDVSWQAHDRLPGNRKSTRRLIPLVSVGLLTTLLLGLSWYLWRDKGPQPLQHRVQQPIAEIKTPTPAISVAAPPSAIPIGKIPHPPDLNQTAAETEPDRSSAISTANGNGTATGNQEDQAAVDDRQARAATAQAAPAPKQSPGNEEIGGNVTAKVPSPKTQAKSVDQRPTESNTKAGAAPTPVSKQPETGNQPTAASDVTKPPSRADILAALTAVPAAKPNPPPDPVKPAVRSDEKQVPKGAGGGTPNLKVDQPKTEPSVQNTSNNSSEGLVVATAAAATAPEGKGGDLASATELDTVTVGLEERLRQFIETYCDAYAAKNLDAFTGFFTADAMENGRSFESLLPKYEKNFTLINAIQYRIRLTEFSVNEDQMVTLNGDFFLEWLPPDKKWRENSGRISMRLQESGSTFLVQRLDYHGD